MWHGLARTGRDFDAAAVALSQTYVVICPDTVGRGLSSWAKDPETEYCLKNYAAQALAVLDYYGVNSLRWLGTSMGGLIGIVLAGGALKERITHLLINDIGPAVPADALGRIVEYVGAPPIFDTLPEFEAWLRLVYAPFGQNTPHFWRIMADTSARHLPDGRITAHYDPKITWQFTQHADELPIWQDYDAIKAKTMLARGAASDVLPQALADEMCARGPKPDLLLFDNCGHAPTFSSPDAIAKLRAFFT